MPKPTIKNNETEPKDTRQVHPPKVIKRPQFLEIIHLVAEGNSILKATKKARVSVRSWYAHLDRAPKSDKELYRHAKEDQADSHAELIINAAEDVRKGKLDPKAGKVVIDALKWVASKLRPLKYGDRVDMNISGNVNVAHLIVDARQRMVNVKQNKVIPHRGDDVQIEAPGAPKKE